MKTNETKNRRHVSRWYGWWMAMACFFALTGGPSVAKAQGSAGTTAENPYIVYVQPPQSGSNIIVGLPFKKAYNVNNFLIETSDNVTMAANSGDTHGITVENGGKRIKGGFISAGDNFSDKILFEILPALGTDFSSGQVYNFTIQMGSDQNCNSAIAYFRVQTMPVPVITLMNDKVVCQNTEYEVTAVDFIPTAIPSGSVVLKYAWTASIAEADKGNVEGLVLAADGIYASGTALLTATVKNKSDKAIDIVYEVTPSAEYTINGKTVTVTGGKKTVTVTLNPQIDLEIIPASLAQSVCNNSATDIQMSTSNGGDANTYSWTVKAGTGTGISGAAAGSGAVIAQTLTNSGIEPQTVTYIITHSNTTGGVACRSNEKEVVVTVLPAIDMEVDKTSETLCSGETSAIRMSTANTGATQHKYTWKLKGIQPAGVTIGAGTGVTAEADGSYSVVAADAETPALAMKLENNGVTPQKVVFEAEHQYVLDGVVCKSNKKEVTFTVNPVLDLTVNGENKDNGSAVVKTICSSESVDAALTSALTAGEGIVNQVSWTSEVMDGASVTGNGNSGGALNFTPGLKIADNLVNAGTMPGVVKYTVTQTYEKDGISCQKVIYLEVTVNPAIQIKISVGNTAFVCSENEQTVTFSTDPALPEDKIEWSWRFDYKSSEISSVAGDGISADTPSAGFDNAAKGSGSTFKVTLTNPNHTAVSVVVVVTARYKGSDCSQELPFTINVNPKPVFELGE